MLRQSIGSRGNTVPGISGRSFRVKYSTDGQGEM